jgi:hypothetical protein
MRDLERELRAARVDWPATPDLAVAVVPRLEARSPRPSRRRHARYAAVLVALLLGGVAAVEPARSAVLEFLGLKSVKIERREPTATPAPPAGADLNLGRPVSQAEAERLVAFRPRPPSSLGEPDGIFFSDGPPVGGGVSYTYRPRAGIRESAETGVAVLVSQFPATVQPFLEKTIGMGTRVDRFRIDGAPAYFISGEAHGVAYQDENGGYFEEQRLAGTTLLVERDGLLVRIEGELSRARATAIARSI